MHAASMRRMTAPSILLVQQVAMAEGRAYCFRRRNLRATFVGSSPKLRGGHTAARPALPPSAADPQAGVGQARLVRELLLADAVRHEIAEGVGDRDRGTGIDVGSRREGCHPPRASEDPGDDPTGPRLEVFPRAGPAGLGQ